MFQTWMDIPLRLLILALAVVLMAMRISPKTPYGIELPAMYTPNVCGINNEFAAVVFVDKEGRMLVSTDDTVSITDTIAANNYGKLDKQIAAITKVKTGYPIGIYADKATSYSVVARVCKSIAAARHNSYGWQWIYLVVKFKQWDSEGSLYGR